MSGMKEGAGEDPFADDGASDETEEPREEPDSANLQTQSGLDSDNEEENTRQQMQIPYKFRRDGVQEGRSRVPLFIQDETKTGEREALRELEERFDEDISLTDLREALVKTGLQNLDEVEDEMEKWGYGMTFGE